MVVGRASSGRELSHGDSRARASRQEQNRPPLALTSIIPVPWLGILSSRCSTHLALPHPSTLSRSIASSVESLSTARANLTRFICPQPFVIHTEQSSYSTTSMYLWVSPCHFLLACNRPHSKKTSNTHFPGGVTVSAPSRCRLIIFRMKQLCSWVETNLCAKPVSHKL